MGRGAGLALPAALCSVWRLGDMVPCFLSTSTPLFSFGDALAHLQPACAPACCPPPSLYTAVGPPLLI